MNPTDIDIDALGGTSFQRDVWRALTKIPRGETRTYAQLAAMAGHPTAIRAVANAVGKNPMPPIIPCHRIIRSDGKIGGYSAPGGITTKRRLLQSEGVKFPEI
ncbi:MAG: MGMT family protein [Alphaproteobacteria bacterium]|nr:MGMT family protein [Alphaproteobacteria bacterium]